MMTAFSTLLLSVAVLLLGIVMLGQERRLRDLRDDVDFINGFDDTKE